jgi:tRNA threonylcarbamoyladenosine biosynthesis protein TsaB
MILVFDTSIEGFSVGILDLEGKVIHEINNTTPYSHTQFLVPAINQVLSECSIQFQDLTKIITTNGPGSFTGIRVGLATAAGLQAALNIPIITVNTLTALTYAWIVQKNDIHRYIHTVLDTKCGEVYHQTYKYQDGKLITVTDPVSISILTLEQQLDHRDLVIASLSSSAMLQQIPHQVVDLSLFSIWKASDNVNPSTLQPLYVRTAAITYPKN